MVARESFDGLHVWHNRGAFAQDNRARQARRVDLVHLVCLVHLVGLVQPNKLNNGLLMLVDCFSTLLDEVSAGIELVLGVVD